MFRNENSCNVLHSYSDNSKVQVIVERVVRALEGLNDPKKNSKSAEELLAELHPLWSLRRRRRSEFVLSILLDPDLGLVKTRPSKSIMTSVILDIKFF